MDETEKGSTKVFSWEVDSSDDQGQSRWNKQKH